MPDHKRLIIASIVQAANVISMKHNGYLDE